MKKIALLFTVLVLTLSLSCGRGATDETTQKTPDVPASPPATEVIVYAEDPEDRTKIIAEFTLPNCENTVPQTETVEESLSRGETLTLKQELTLQAGGGVQIPGIGQINVGAEIAKKVGADYSEIETRTRSLELAAGPGTKMFFTVIRHDEVHKGKLVIQAGETRYETPYELITNFWLEYEEENLGCPDIPEEKASVDRVIISPANLTLEKTETKQLGITVLDANGNEVTDREVFWNSLNPRMADVVNGLVSGENIGTATITATVDGVEGSVNVKVVEQSVNSVSVTPESITMEVGDTEQLSVIVHDSRGNEITDRSITWSRNNTAVVDISSNGLVTAKSAGTVDITANVDGRTDTVAVTVTHSVGSVSISPRDGSITVGDYLQLTATVRDLNGNLLIGRPIDWESENPSVAVFSADGEVEGISAGTATIIANVEGVEDSVFVTVTAPLQPPIFNAPPNEFSPNIGTAGEIVTLYGQNFDGPGLQVTFAGTPAEIVEVTSTRIKIQIPSGVYGSAKIFITIGDWTIVSIDYFAIY